MTKKEYRVYQNMTQFATTVYANSEKEAIAKAEKQPQEEWDDYEPVMENIFYDAVCMNPRQSIKKDEFRSNSKKWIVALWKRLEELDPKYDHDDFYAELDDWFKSHFG